MPKASKRQKEKKADFQKTKLKLGKGKQAANNATDVSFKAKTIALPQQSINVDKSGKLVNSRNLTITDLALQLRHYSAGVRRDAVSGIKEILTLHPSLILTDAASLIPELARCIGDEDAAVRKQLHVLLSWMLPQIPAQLLGPYHGTLLLFTTSALSHIYPEVRIGAVKILDLVFEIVSLMLALWRGSSSPSSKARTSLADTLGHISVYFPFSHHTGSSGLSAKAKSAVVQMDLAYAELAALLALNEAASQKIKSKFNVEVQIASVSSFIAELLSTPVTESGTVSLASTGASAGSVLDPDTFRALLPTLWFLLGTEHESLLDSLLATYHSQASTHKVKAVLFEFLARAFLLSKVRAASPFTASESERILESLLTAFPRTLWEAANSSSGQAFAGVQLEFLHFLLLLPSPPAKLAYEKLGPLYWIRHPTKNVSVPGPWNKLPPSLRKLALDNITLLQGRDAKLDKALSQALEFAQARS
uniref:Pre-rRNA-processing protein n=1 Tax=Kalmanozyma brasiliensis (strain GHG001) TaxID=1365824 RepID=V5GSM4_KALBG